MSETPSVENDFSPSADSRPMGADTSIGDIEAFLQAQPDHLLGTQLAGRYDILSVIASGGMGIVYKGRHILMDKTVAIKMLNAGYVNEPGALARFQHEAKVACKLDHPNIVVVHDFGIADEKLLYLVMDFVEGQTLAQILDEKSCLPSLRVLNIARQLCDALEYAHSQDLIHRDIKPSNVMLVQTKDDQDFVKVLDFGLAKFLGEGKQQILSQTGYVFGTGFYMSPEQCRGKPADVRSEVYAVGCVLYEAITGLPPLVGENLLETCQKHIEEVPAKMSMVRSDLNIPATVEDLVARALSKNPADRCQTALEFRKSVEECVSILQHKSLVPVTDTKTENSRSSLSTVKTVEASGAIPPSSLITQSAEVEMQTPSPKAGALSDQEKLTEQVDGNTDKTELTPVKKVPASVKVFGILFSLLAIGLGSALHFVNEDAHRTPGLQSSNQAKMMTDPGLLPDGTRIYATTATAAMPVVSKQVNPAIPATIVERPDPVWSKYYGGASVAFDKEKFGAAEKLLRRAVIQARHSNDSKRVLISLKKLEDVLYVQQRYRDADKLNAEIQKLALSEQPSANAAVNSADVLKNGPATSSLKPASELSKASEPQDERIAQLAMSCHKKGQCDTAVSLLEHSIQITKRVHGPKSLQTAARLSELVSLYMALDEPEKAQPLMDEVMEIKAENTRAKKPNQTR